MNPSPEAGGSEEFLSSASRQDTSKSKENIPSLSSLMCENMSYIVILCDHAILM